MTCYELMFEVDALTDAQEGEVIQVLDALVATHSGVTVIELSSEGSSAIGAARSAAAQLRQHGVVARRLVEDVVTRNDIAARANITPQAVGLWVRGERCSEEPFPAPYVLAGGGLWLWGEVNDWLGRRGHPVGEDVAYPARADYPLVNAEILLTAGAQRDGGAVSVRAS